MFGIKKTKTVKKPAKKKLIKVQNGKKYKIQIVRGKFRFCEFVVYCKFVKRENRYIFTLSKREFISSLDPNNYDIAALQLKLPDGKDVRIELHNSYVMAEL